MKDSETSVIISVVSVISEILEASNHVLSREHASSDGRSQAFESERVLNHLMNLPSVRRAPLEPIYLRIALTNKSKWLAIKTYKNDL